MNEFIIIIRCNLLNRFNSTRVMQRECAASLCACVRSYTARGACAETTRTAKFVWSYHTCPMILCLNVLFRFHFAFSIHETTPRSVPRYPIATTVVLSGSRTNLGYNDFVMNKDKGNIFH